LTNLVFGPNFIKGGLFQESNFVIPDEGGEMGAVTEEQIREMAYHIWEKEGRPDGKDVEHYFRAKAMLEERKNRVLPGETEAAPSVSSSRPHPTGRSAARPTGKGRSRKKT
jgi:hypothetical protein